MNGQKISWVCLMIATLVLLIWLVERIFSPKFRRKIMSKVEI
jgi:hypothetical protein